VKESFKKASVASPGNLYRVIKMIYKGSRLPPRHTLPQRRLNINHTIIALCSSPPAVNVALLRAQDAAVANATEIIYIFLSGPWFIKNWYGILFRVE